MILDRSPLEFVSTDLAPGDAKSAAMDVRGLELVRIPSSSHPLFDEAYEGLWREFGTKNEMETRDVLGRRLEWNPAHPHEATALLYDLVAVREAGKIIALRDHTAIVPLDDPEAEVVVHLSHVLVKPDWRRSGLAGWMRALPLQSARECVTWAGLAPAFPITLAAEMERPRKDSPASQIRLRAYEKAGFHALDPAQVPYLQPDFRDPETIDATGGARPLPFVLIVRRVGRESGTEMSGAAARQLVETIYRMYDAVFRAQDMAPVMDNLAHFPADDETIRLLAPSDLEVVEPLPQ